METMSLLLALGLLMVGFCPADLCYLGWTLDIRTPPPDDQDRGGQMDTLGIASSNADFAFSLYRLLASANPGKNVVFSPASISVAMAFLAIGARNTSLKEILEGLSFNLTETPEADIHRGFQHLLHALSRPGDQLQLSTGSAMFVQEQMALLAKFREDARALYAAQAFTTNFREPAAAKKLINDYVKEQTQGKISHLINDLSPDTSMVLVNYIFFKAKWKTPFDPRDTFKSVFYVSMTKLVQVAMMSIENLAIPYFRDEELACTLVELPYVGNASALFIRPDLGKMQDVEAKLLPETLSRWRRSLQKRWINKIYLPKFSISSDYNLGHMLTQLGIKEVFSEKADLSGITGIKNLKVSEVVHKAVLDVAEKGTEAAAATGIKMIAVSAIVNPVIVSFNMPFLMAITHTDTQSLLFLAKIANPKQA